MSRVAPRARRRAGAVLSALAAEHGEVEVVHRHWACATDEYDALLDTFEAFDRVGGASARVENPDGDLLLVSPADREGWTDPGDRRRPGEEYPGCARRAVRRATGLAADLEGLAEVTVFHADDPTARDPVPYLAVVYEGRASGDPVPGPGVDAARWFDGVPDTLVYEELAERADGRTVRGD